MSGGGDLCTLLAEVQVTGRIKEQAHQEASTNRNTTNVTQYPIGISPHCHQQQAYVIEATIKFVERAGMVNQI